MEDFAINISRIIWQSSSKLQSRGQINAWQSPYADTSWNANPEIKNSIAYLCITISMRCSKICQAKLLISLSVFVISHQNVPTKIGSKSSTTLEYLIIVYTRHIFTGPFSQIHALIGSYTIACTAEKWRRKKKFKSTFSRLDNFFYLYQNHLFVTNNIFLGIKTSFLWD